MPRQRPQSPGGPRRSFFSDFYTIPNIKTKQELCSWIALCHFLSLLGKTDLWRSCQRSAWRPRRSKNSLWDIQWSSDPIGLSTICQEFLSLTKVLGHQWPTEVQRSLESLEVLKISSRGIATCDFPNLNYAPGGDIPPALVYFLQITQILSKVAKCYQVNRRPTYLSVLATKGIKLLILEVYPCHT